MECGKCLNPFEFRAGLKRSSQLPSEGSGGLNPFEFRAGLKRETNKGNGAKGGLNPFEFRAGLKPPPMPDYLSGTPRLNPFEFRAGLKQRGGDVMTRCAPVLIPLNSGLA